VEKTLENISKDKFFITDKGKFRNNNPEWIGHNYWQVYDSFFENLKDEKISFLEFGFGASGDCLRTFAEFFENADLIAGADYNMKFVEGIKFEDPRIQTFYVDQESIPSLEELSQKFDNKKFDIIIDDASHSPIPIRNTFDVFFDLVKDGGYYIIEDTYLLTEEMINGKNNIISELYLAANEDSKWWSKVRNINYKPIKKSVQYVYTCLGLTIIKKGKQTTYYGN